MIYRRWYYWSDARRLYNGHVLGQVFRYCKTLILNTAKTLSVDCESIHLTSCLLMLQALPSSICRNRNSLSTKGDLCQLHSDRRDQSGSANAGCFVWSNGRTTNSIGTTQTRLSVFVIAIRIQSRKELTNCEVTDRFISIKMSYPLENEIDILKI